MSPGRVAFDARPHHAAGGRGGRADGGERQGQCAGEEAVSGECFSKIFFLQCKKVLKY